MYRNWLDTDKSLKVGLGWGLVCLLSCHYSGSHMVVKFKKEPNRLKYYKKDLNASIREILWWLDKNRHELHAHNIHVFDYIL